MLTQEELQKRFGYHKPKTEAAANTHEHIRDVCRRASETILAQIPESREASMFVTKMEEAMFWANAAIARNQP